MHCAHRDSLVGTGWTTGRVDIWPRSKETAGADGSREQCGWPLDWDDCWQSVDGFCDARAGARPGEAAKAEQTRIFRRLREQERWEKSREKEGHRKNV